jgi:hypothetical protein
MCRRLKPAAGGLKPSVLTDAKKEIFNFASGRTLGAKRPPAGYFNARRTPGQLGELDSANSANQ